MKEENLQNIYNCFKNYIENESKDFNTEYTLNPSPFDVILDEIYNYRTGLHTYDEYLSNTHKYLNEVHWNKKDYKSVLELLNELKTRFINDITKCLDFTTSNLYLKEKRTLTKNHLKEQSEDSKFIIQDFRKINKGFITWLNNYHDPKHQFGNETDLIREVFSAVSYYCQVLNDPDNKVSDIKEAYKYFVSYSTDYILEYGYTSKDVTDVFDILTESFQDYIDSLNDKEYNSIEYLLDSFFDALSRYKDVERRVKECE